MCPSLCSFHRLWQVQLNDANAKVVSIQNGLTSQALKATQVRGTLRQNVWLMSQCVLHSAHHASHACPTQDLTQTIQEAAAGASLYSQDPTVRLPLPLPDPAAMSSVADLADQCFPHPTHPCRRASTR